MPRVKKPTTKKTEAKEKKPRVAKIKEPEPKPAVEETAAPAFDSAKLGDRYLSATGRRKTAIARVRMWTRGEKEFLVNQKPLEKYFPSKTLQLTALAALETMKCLDKFSVQVVVKGGGLSGQAEAIRHGTAQALVDFNPDFRKRLKKAGFLKRDPRMRERKKFGLKRARRAPQWAKR